MSSMTQRYQMIAESIFDGTKLDSHATLGASDTEHGKNVDILRVSYRVWFSILADFSLQANLSMIQADALIRRLQHCVESTTYVQLSETCSDLYDFARRLSSYDQFKFSAFKAQSRHEFVFVLRPFIEKVRESCDAGWIMRILTLCVFPFRTRVVDSRLQDDMLSSYLSIEDEIEHNDLQGYPDPLVDGVNKILRHWLKDWTEPVVPSLTAGTVSDADLRTRAEKYAALAEDPLIEYLLAKEQGTSIAFFAPHELKPRDRVERIIFVPKNATKLRTVCCQPITLQYYQSGIQQSIYRHMRKNGYLRTHIPIQDQDEPRRLAAQGSKYSTLATLDLSAASDRISWSLVKRLFRGTRYLRWMCATRAKYSLLPNGETVSSQKAFAMGACLCFPTMSLVLAAIVSYCEKRFHDWNRPWTVYGDDIICPCDWVPAVLLILKSFGLVVNESKSFFGYNDSYRESCGIECWNGNNITPIRFPRTFSPNVSEAKICSCLIDMANRFFDNDCKVARLTCFRLLKELANYGPYSKRQIAFSSESLYLVQHFSADNPFFPNRIENVLSWHGCLASDNATNHRVNRKRNTVMCCGRVCSLGHEEVRCYYSSMRPKPPKWRSSEDDLRYFDTLLEQYRRSALSLPENWEEMSLDAYAFEAKLVPSMRIGWLCP